jgi:hypothetical protein
MITVMQGTHIKCPESGDAVATKEEVAQQMPETQKISHQNREHMRFESMTRGDLMKQMQLFNWTVRSSTTTRIYFQCKFKECDVEIRAHATLHAQWSLDMAHTTHPCGGGVKNSIFNGMYSFKNSLPESVVNEIENLSTLTSPQIQKHLLSKDPLMLVDTRLIQNMTYRIKQKVFGSQGDIVHLLEQQQVAVHQSVYTLGNSCAPRNAVRWVTLTNSFLRIVPSSQIFFSVYTVCSCLPAGTFSGFRTFCISLFNTLITFYATDRTALASTDGSTCHCASRLVEDGFAQ